MLTAEQIKNALHQIEHEYDGYRGPRDEMLGYAHDALEACERVVALAESLRTMSVLSAEEHDHNMRVADMIDRTLDGSR